jgi:hypothetical protein
LRIIVFKKYIFFKKKLSNDVQLGAYDHHIKSQQIQKIKKQISNDVQLGAYDHRAIAPGESMHFFKTTSTAEFSVPVTSIKYGDQVCM